MKNNKGYVYILINPSFHENWIKIGKTSREVDIRSKELSNTSVPLPFEIYATLKTSKYAEVEKILHKIFTELADKRINKNREFFNIRPEKALEYLKDQASIISDSELNIPDDDQCSKSKYRYKVNTDKVFIYAKDTVDAKMKVLEGNKYIVLAGSKIDLGIYSNKDRVSKLREENKNKLNNDIVIENISFESPSAAGQFVSGGASNGKIYWRTEDNNTKLENFIEYI